MPIYEYECDKCGHRFERIQKFADPPVKVCPECKGRKVHRMVSAPAFQFKGEGWYVTDYSDKGKEAREKSKAEAKSTESKAGDSASKASDTKPADKKAAKADAKKPSKAKD